MGWAGRSGEEEHGSAETLCACPLDPTAARILWFLTDSLITSRLASLARVQFLGMAKVASRLSAEHRGVGRGGDAALGDAAPAPGWYLLGAGAGCGYKVSPDRKPNSKHSPARLRGGGGPP